MHANFVVVNSGNLLQNPGGSSSSISPWVTTGSWAVQIGAIAVSTWNANTLNSCNASPWFLNYSSLTKSPCGSPCSAATNPPPSLTQTVSLSRYTSAIQNNSPRLVYGGDAFAAVKSITQAQACTQVACHQGDYDAIFRVEFFNSSNQSLGSNSSTTVLHPQNGCAFHTEARTKCNSRQTASVVPPGTTSFRFTATMTDRLFVCDNPPTTFKFANGFDNLFAEIIYRVDDSGLGNPNREKKPTAP